MTEIKLLTDQRSPEKKIADDLVERFRAAYPHIAEIGRNFHKGGLVENITFALDRAGPEAIIPRSARFSRFVTKDGHLGFRVEPITRIVEMKMPGDDEIIAALGDKSEEVRRRQLDFYKTAFGEPYEGRWSGGKIDPSKYRKD